MRRYIDFYLASMKISILEQIQYSVANYFYMIGMITEPVIYLVVWTTIARQQGGTAGGYTVGAFAAYYIIWTLVRNMNKVPPRSPRPHRVRASGSIRSRSGRRADRRGRNR